MCVYLLQMFVFYLFGCEPSVNNTNEWSLCISSWWRHYLNICDHTIYTIISLDRISQKSCFYFMIESLVFVKQWQMIINFVCFVFGEIKYQNDHPDRLRAQSLIQCLTQLFNIDMKVILVQSWVLIQIIIRNAEFVFIR